MADNQAEMPVGTLAQEAEQSETTTKTETPASEQPKVELEVDTDEQDAKANDADESGDEDESDGESKPKKASGSARLKARLAAAEAELERLRTFVPTQTDADSIAKAVEAEIGPPPKESEYSDYLAYERALTAYEVDKRQAERTMRKEAASIQARQQEAASLVLEDHQARVDQVRKVLPDYDQKVKGVDFSALGQAGAKMVIESRKSAELAYYFATHPQAMQEIGRMNEVAAARRIGHLEASVRLPKPETSTRAPAPPAKISGGSAPPARRAEEARSMEEFAAIRLKQLGYK